MEQDPWVKALVEDIIEEEGKKEDVSVRARKLDPTAQDKTVNAQDVVMNSHTSLVYRVVRTNVQNVVKPW
ncbi:hypothetical protein [uncultured Methanolobus sp.]|uniref:hypothetical protein n=1 Tax=uncultured Methanolobus sp. TaxID=218300 RepID=UPI0029C6E7BB|nr:hypothetical protein [uncultured Methanolobus sp.]